MLQKMVMVLTLAAMAGCSSVGEVMPVGPDTYTVGSEKGGQFWTMGPSWSDVKALGLNRANEYCAKQNKTMSVVNWDTHGARGWTPLNAELTFKCEDKAK